MTCELRQVRPAYAQQLLNDPDEVIQYYERVENEELPEEQQGEDLDLDKAWHGLHYLLTGTAWGGVEPQCYLLLGGEQVGDEEEHTVGYGPARILSPTQVAAFYDAVNELNPAIISARFNPIDMTEQDIYPSVWDREDEELEGWLQESTADLKSFLKRATKQKQAVIISII